MNVNEALEGIAVVGFETIEPEDAGNDGVTPGGIGREDFTGGNAGFENGTRGKVIADFFSDTEFTCRCAVASGFAAEAEFGGGDGVEGDGFAIAEEGHALFRNADEDGVAAVSGAGAEEGAESKDGKDARRGGEYFLRPVAMGAALKISE